MQQREIVFWTKGWTVSCLSIRDIWVLLSEKGDRRSSNFTRTWIQKSLVEYSDDVIKFISNILNSDLINEIKINERIDGTKQTVVVVDAKKKGVVVGREGRNAEKARILAKRYFQISNVLIVSGEQTLNNNEQVNI